jgi:hypothetical protein
MDATKDQKKKKYCVYTEHVQTLFLVIIP